MSSPLVGILQSFAAGQLILDRSEDELQQQGLLFLQKMSVVAEYQGSTKMVEQFNALILIAFERIVEGVEQEALTRIGLDRVPRIGFLQRRMPHAVG
ncbi:hypothetical protein [Bifidobacterium crudilactis]|uniref:hypothetical protein n=1 Tax=Bifidobacterium crudilactis TaxID=327277 RepID=UPI002648F9CE|nr:hypothetical protein [Bifidobacterium crudilactis]MDN6209606.1 hypothetical protein [Bifidobacterium crudilactis]